MHPELLNTVFEPWRRTADAGFGLGLSIVQRMAQRLGWQVEITSQPGKGTSVYLFPNGGKVNAVEPKTRERSVDDDDHSPRESA